MLRLRMKAWWNGAVVLAVLAAVWVPGAVTAQSGAQRDVPVIQPTYTRIFGSDTLEIYGAQLSPDERWIMFEADGLWVVSTDGGDPIRLTDRGSDGAVWFPTSDRVAFRSDNGIIMTLPIDSRTGRPIGTPRPVTLDGSFAYFDVSPDGKWIAYTPREHGHRVIRIVPSNGGAARTLVAADTPTPIWNSDGRHIYYPVAVGSHMGLLRIAVEGGQPDTVVTAGWVRTGHASLLVSERGNARAFKVTTLQGEPRARFRLPEEMRLGGATGPDARNRLLTTVSGFGEALQILPIDGGPARQLTDGHQPDNPLGWTDKDEILFSTQLNGKEMLLLAPAGGGEMRQVRLPEARRRLLNNRVPPPFLSRDGSHLFYEVAADDPDLSVLKVLSLRDGTIEQITSAHAGRGPRVFGPGGIPHFNGAEFVYFQRQAAGYELRAWTPEGGSRRLRTFSADERIGPVGIRGDRIVYAAASGAGRSLRITGLNEPRSRELLSVVGWLQALSWSPDGRYVAMVHVDSTGGWESARVALLQVSPSGEPAGVLRYVSEPSLSWWNLRWLPDSRGVLANGWDDANVWLFPVDPGDRPVCVTQDESTGVYEFVLSPDGRHIVYPRRVPRGSSIWMVDLGEIPGGAQ